MTKYCSIHTDQSALNFCNSCKEYFCSDCLSEGSDYYYCNNDECQKQLNIEISNVKKSPLQGIGGWLILIAIGVITFPISCLIIAFTDFGFMNDPEYAGYMSAFLIEGVVSLILCGYGIYIAKLFFTKDIRLPQMFIYLLIINTIWVIADIMLVAIIFELSIESLIDRDIIRSVLQAAIWIPYFKKSVRVKNTFVRKSGYQQGELYSSSD